ncbi:hypothetical protein [Methylicorpusculum sp.]|uniref:hypothetical protein n=1 Tax=Methylicorpusculum sp. TaxID=2713644 RepID=UPI002ABC096C|nr:hypothetical protein [Methylicorpusculum sp.]MDZ4153458.1 hypothetical protein [Methylicorpusculum sp.]
MKQFLCFGLLMTSAFVVSNAPSDGASVRQGRPAPEQRSMQGRVRQSREEQNFNRLHRRNADDLSRQVRRAYDNRDVTRLRNLAALGRQFAAQAQSRHNARFGSSAQFHHRFSVIADRAERYARQLRDGTRRAVPFDMSYQGRGDSLDDNLLNPSAATQTQTPYWREPAVRPGVN